MKLSFVAINLKVCALLGLVLPVFFMLGQRKELPTSEANRNNYTCLSVTSITGIYIYTETNVCI